MTLDVILFFIFGIVAAVTAVIMITRSNPVISALFLVLNFAALAGLYLTLNAQFIAVTQIIVYAGAIMVLFLFVLMFSTNIQHDLFPLAGNYINQDTAVDLKQQDNLLSAEN